MSGFDSSDDDRRNGATLSEPLPLRIDWVDFSNVGVTSSVAISGLPGCRFKETWRNLSQDIEYLKQNEITTVFVLCTIGEMNRYRVPNLMDQYQAASVVAHHYPFPDGTVPDRCLLSQMHQELLACFHRGEKPLVHCFGGLGRSCLVVACLVLHLNEALTPEDAIALMRRIRGPRAIQTVKYNFITDFRKPCDDFQTPSRPISR